MKKQDYLKNLTQVVQQDAQTNALIQLVLDLCKIDATTGNEKGSVDFLESLLTKSNWKTKRQPVGPEKGRDNLWAFASDTAPAILFTTHLDTVPNYISPKISEDGQSLIGRGVCDAKGIAACMIMAAEQLRQQNISVGLLFVVGEETNSAGAKAAAQLGIRVKYVVNGEPTQLKLVRAMKGIVVFELKAKGVAGHSAYPEVGHSAVHQLITDLNNLLQFDWPSSDDLGKTTCNIGVIQGGNAHNVIAEEASAIGSIRATVKAEKIIELLKGNIHPKTVVNILSSSDPQYLKVVDGLDTNVVSFGSDIPYLRSIGEPLLLGPGSILDAHTVHEQIQIEDLNKAVELYVKLGMKL